MERGKDSEIGDVSTNDFPFVLSALSLPSLLF